MQFHRYLYAAHIININVVDLQLLDIFTELCGVCNSSSSTHSGENVIE